MLDSRKGDKISEQGFKEKKQNRRLLVRQEANMERQAGFNFLLAWNFFLCLSPFLGTTSPSKCTFSWAKMFTPILTEHWSNTCLFPPSFILRLTYTTYQNSLFSVCFLLGFLFHFIAIVRFFFFSVSTHDTAFGGLRTDKRYGKL